MKNFQFSNNKEKGERQQIKKYSLDLLPTKFYKYAIKRPNDSEEMTTTSSHH